jgi:ribonucleoside-triphosphate reductase
LSSVNGAKVKSKHDFLECVKAATIIGTLQATYTEFPYLSRAAKLLTEKEALLGVSITGMMDNPKILLDPEIQRAGAEHAKKINDQWAKKVSINPAARITCIKPEGTGSMVLESASGIHAWHARKFFRRVQVNKLDPVYQHFKKINPHMVEESIWSANKTDDVVTFAVEVPETAMIKADLTAIKHLDIIKSTQENWVNAGNTEHNTKIVGHNVSCTIIVGDDEWEVVKDYLYSNRTSFAAVSFLSKTGDKDYKQAPLESITSENDERKWKEIKEKYTPVNYKQLKESEDATHVQQELVCAGGACELPILSA